MDKKDIKILVIEDDPMLSKIYQTRLSQLEYSFFSATDGEEGLKMIRDIIPHLIILDIMMPKKSGFEIFTALKQDSKLSGIPVVVVSNLGQIDDIRKCEQFGIDAFMCKANVKLEVILNKIEEILTKKLHI